MTVVLLHVLLTLVWLFLTGSFSPANLLLGFLVTLGLLRLLPPATSRQSRPNVRGRPFGSTVVRLIAFLPYFARALVWANLQLAWAVLSPKNRLAPEFVECDLPGLSKAQAVVVATCITLTPGTLSIQLSKNGRSVLVHALFSKGPEQVRAQVRALQVRLWGQPPPPGS